MGLICIYQLLCFNYLMKLSGISPGFISLQGDGNSVELGNGEINLAKSEEGITKGGITLSPLFLEIKNENGQVNHTFTFPTQAVNNSSTMVISVNNQVADEQGEIDLSEAIFTKIKMKTPEGKIVEISVENDLTISTREII